MPGLQASSSFEWLKKAYSALAFLWLLFAAQGAMAQNLENVARVKSLKDKKPFEFGGSLGLGASYYNSNAAIKRVAPWNWYISGSPYMRIYGLHIPFTFTYSETGRSLTHPFHYNFTGASPYFKWATTHLGYRSMNFSEYTVSGVVFNGVGIELKPGNLRLGAFYGVFNPAVEADTSNGNFGVILPAYKRTGYGAKLGYGSDRNYFDFIYFRGKDDPNSLRNAPGFETIKPVDNVTFGPRFKVTFFKRWFVESDLALSVFTRNVLNDTLKETEDLRTVYKFVRVNTTTYGSFAGHVATGVNFNKWSLSLKARQVSSDFQSLGINLLQDDLREFTANPSLRLFKGKLGLSGSYGFYTDNISGKRLNTTVRNILNTNLSLQPHQRVNLGLGYSNFGTTRSNGLVQMNDSITFSIINENYNGNISLMAGKIKNPVVFSLFTQYQQADDRNIFTRQFNSSKVFNAGLNLQHKLAKLRTQIGGGVAYAEFMAAGKTFNTRNANLSVRKNFAGNKLNTGLNISYAQRFQESIRQGEVMCVNLSLQTKLGKHHNIQAQARLMRNTTGIVSNTAFNEQRFSIQYGFQF